MSKAKIYLNSNCSKCNQLSIILNSKDISFNIIEYLITPPKEIELKDIINLGISAKDLIRTGEDEWKTTGLDIETASDDDLINAIIQYPILLQRPIVIANGKAVIARPPEKVLEIL